MSDLVQTSSDSLCELVRWAHSHGTICSLIPSLQHLTRGSYGNLLTAEPSPHGSTVPVAIWGCSAGHAYHWPLSEHGNGRGSSANTGQGQRFVGGRLANKVHKKPSCCSRKNSTVNKCYPLPDFFFLFAHLPHLNV